MKTKNRILFITALIFAFMFILAISSYSAAVYDSNNNKYLPTEDKVFYLPSHIKPNSVSFAANDEPKVIDLTSSKTTDANGNEVYKYNLFGATFTFYFANSLPSIYATTSVPLENLLRDKSVRDKEVKMFITDKHGYNYYFDNADTTSEIKMRGNATANMKKPPFQIKLDKKHDLFGMGEAKTWILLCNYTDQSIIRNSVMYKIGELLGIKTCENRSVDLYLNGEYYGVYLLCEKVQVHPERVDIFDLEKENELLNPNNLGFTRIMKSGTLINETIITEYQYVRNMVNPADISGGYLVELDNNYYKDEKCYFVTSNGNHYVIKSPELASQEQVEYIARVFAEMEEAIYSPTGKNSKGIHFSQYIDVESLAYGYILQEYGRNWDSGSSSLYFYKDRDVNGKYTKIVKGPLWDCDNTLGNMVKLRNGDPGNNPETYWSRGSQLWKGLLQHEYFNYVVSKSFARIYPELIKLTEPGGFVSQVVNDIGTSIVMDIERWEKDDYSRWPMYSDYVFKDVHADTWQSGQVYQYIDGKYSNGKDDDDSTVIGYLNTYIIRRANWLKSEWTYNENDTAPNISSDGFIDENAKMPVAPTFT
ncbi:MAG: CotH kinase family protein, partial [Clostridia bacterium]|nr:CotH kinase family protein [Clostridia bacterium]